MTPTTAQVLYRMGNLEGGKKKPKGNHNSKKGRSKWESSRYRGGKGERQMLY